MRNFKETMAWIEEQIQGDIIAHVGQNSLDIIKKEIKRLKDENKKLRAKIKETKR